MYNAGVFEAVTSANLTRTTALQAANAEYLNIVNNSYINMISGKSYKQATREAVTRLARKGITGQTYISSAGRVTNMRIHDAVRRQLLTSSSQLAGRMTIARNAEWGNNFVETSSHAGSRPNHATWQGSIFAIVGATKQYRNLALATGYGGVAGLKGANCGHDMYSYIPGISKKRFDKYDEKETAKTYRESQTQRRYEKSIRREKEALLTDDARNDKDAFTKHSKSLKQKEKRLNVFKHDTGRTQQSRTSVVGFDNTMRSKAVRTG